MLNYSVFPFNRPVTKRGLMEEMCTLAFAVRRGWWWRNMGPRARQRKCKMRKCAAVRLLSITSINNSTCYNEFPFCDYWQISWGLFHEAGKVKPEIDLRNFFFLFQCRQSWIPFRFHVKCCQGCTARPLDVAKLSRYYCLLFHVGSISCVTWVEAELLHVAKPYRSDIYCLELPGSKQNNGIWIVVNDESK